MPVIESLQKKEVIEHKNIAQLNLEEKSLLSLEHNKKQNLVDFQSHINNRYPFIQPKVPVQESIEIETKEITATDLKKMKENVVKWLIEKVPNAYMSSR